MESALDFVESGASAKEEIMAKKTAATPEQTVADRLPQCVYIGPDRPFGLPLMRNAILRGEAQVVLPQLVKIFEEHPGLETLFVPVAGLAQARQQLKEKGSPLEQTYLNIKKSSDALRAQQKGGKA